MSLLEAVRACFGHWRRRASAEKQSRLLDHERECFRKASKALLMDDIATYEKWIVRSAMWHRRYEREKNRWNHQQD